MSEQENLPRDFKGVFIPREIWLHRELSPQEKLLWAEIHSLDCPKDGCFASNQYFCKFFNCRERELQRWLAKLKNLGFIKIVSFNGRKRIIRSFLKTTHDIFDTSALSKMTPLPCQKRHPSSIGASIEREIKGEIKGYTPPLTPPEKDPETATPEEEEELGKRLKGRSASAKKIQSMRGWREKVLKQIRSEVSTETKSKDESDDRIRRHRTQAMKTDGSEWRGFLIKAYEDRVEFRAKNGGFIVGYAESEEEWKAQTGWE